MKRLKATIVAVVALVMVLALSAAAFAIIVCPNGCGNPLYFHREENKIVYRAVDGCTGNPNPHVHKFTRYYDVYDCPSCGMLEIFNRDVNEVCLAP